MAPAAPASSAASASASASASSSAASSTSTSASLADSPSSSSSSDTAAAAAAAAAADTPATKSNANRIGGGGSGFFRATAASFALPSLLSGSTSTSTSSSAASSSSSSNSSSSSSSSSNQRLMLDYPWLLSTAPSREETPSFWQVVKEKHFLRVATARCKAHLHEPAYGFPSQMLSDAGQTTLAAFEAFSNPETAGSVDDLQPLMVRGLAQMFVDGHQSLIAKGCSPSFSWRPVSSVIPTNSDETVVNSTQSALAARPASALDTPIELRKPLPFSMRLKSVHLTYGPYPSPPDYVAQDWFSFIRLMIPAIDSEFESHPRQKEILKAAEDDGVYIRANVVIDGDLEFVLTDNASGMPLLRDRRSRIEIQFISPHFTPWDEIFEIQPSNGEWRLRWNWRISDIDGLLAQRLEQQAPGRVVQ
eukprot:jgi/Hompol1/5824/HPOL_004729-RA